MFKMRFLVSLNTGKNGKNVNSPWEGPFCWPVVEDRGKNTGRQEEAEARGGLSGTVTWGPGGLRYSHPELVQASLDTIFPASCYGTGVSWNVHSVRSQLSEKLSNPAITML